MKKPKSSKLVRGVALTHELDVWLRARCAAEDKTVSQILRELIREDMKARQA